MTSTAFFRIFGKYELEKMKEFCEKVDLADIESRVRNNWMHKKRLRKQLHEAVIDNSNRENRLAPWMAKVQSKKHNLPEIQLEDNRIRVIETRVKKEILTDAEEYNRDLNEKQKEAVMQAMLQQDEEAANKRIKDSDEAESSMLHTSRVQSDAKAGTQNLENQTFNILPQATRREAQKPARLQATTLMETGASGAFDDL